LALPLNWCIRKERDSVTFASSVTGEFWFVTTLPGGSVLSNYNT